MNYNNPEQLSYDNFIKPEILEIVETNQEYTTTEYSRTFDFIDQAPWWINKHTEYENNLLKKGDDGSLFIQNEFRGIKYNFEIIPGAINIRTKKFRGYKRDENSNKGRCFPTRREKDIFAGIIKLLSNGLGIYLDDTSGVRFYLSDLMDLLSDSKEGVKKRRYNYAQIQEGLENLHATRYSIFYKLKNQQQQNINFSLIERFGTVKGNNKKDIQYFIIFTDLIDLRIKAIEYFPINYTIISKIKNSLSCRIYEIFYINYKQADYQSIGTYHKNAEDILNLAGMMRKKAKWRNLILQIKIALNELVKLDIIQSINDKPIFEEDINSIKKINCTCIIQKKSKNKILGAIIYMKPTKKFTELMKASNGIAKNDKRIAKQIGIKTERIQDYIDPILLKKSDTNEYLNCLNSKIDKQKTSYKSHSFSNKNLSHRVSKIKDILQF